ncbi:ribosomal protein S18-alanine N-acetyltransferase [Candidatus Fermentibacteria bacterium]|nr:ribosomal protein S18-alanine N-acetyltransferase [Candidatus Fermentibacteria bacterium]
MILTALTIRGAVASDAEGIHRVEGEAFPDPWSLRMFSHLIEGGSRASARVMVGCVDERILGFVVAERADPEIHVTNIAVDPSFRRMGIAQRLMQAIVSWSENEGLEEVWLEVREGNHAARALYGALGFVEILRRPQYYRRPVEDALILALFLRGAQALPERRVAVSLEPCS